MSNSNESAQYRGWTNRETWSANLWLSNNESSADFWFGRVARVLEESQEDDVAIRNFAHELQADHEDRAAASLPGTSILTELLRSALDAVNWREIATHYVDDAREAREARAVDLREPAPICIPSPR